VKIKASFDDATVQDIRVAELMKKYGIETIFYWPVNPKQCNEFNGRISLSDDQMDEISKEFEIGSHTISHPLLTRIPITDARVEINDSRIKLQNRFGQEINSFCYPRGYSNPEIQEAVVEAGYTSARSTLVGYLHETENPYFEQTAVHVGCQRKEYASLDWLEYALDLMHIAKKIPDSIYHLWGHSWEIDKNNAWDDLETLLKELTA
jgi:peptidoglycan/xylan/chitin deacetylase (PgdA/CDA1 family)